MADKINQYVKQKNTQHAASFSISIWYTAFCLDVYSTRYYLAINQFVACSHYVLHDDEF